MMFGLGVPELGMVLLIGLIIFGPTTLPKLSRAVGDTIRSIRQGIVDTPAADTRDSEKLIDNK